MVKKDTKVKETKKRKIKAVKKTEKLKEKAKETKKMVVKPKEEKPKAEKKVVKKIEKKKEKAVIKEVKKGAKRSKGVIFTTGKRKRAVARASIKPGSGKILINGEPLDNMKNEILKLRLKEPFILTEKDFKSHDFMVKVKGGGIFGQTDAARQAIARGLVEIFGNELKQKFMEYDRNLLVYDPRRTEPHKPPRSSQGPRRYKQRSKR